MISKPTSQLDYLELLQELSEMPEPKRVAHLFRSAAMEPEIEKPTEAEVEEDEEDEEKDDAA